MNRYEKLNYHKVLHMASNKLAKHNRLVNAESMTKRRVFRDHVLVTWPCSGTTYLIKYIPQYWSHHRVGLTGSELRTISKCSGVVFVLPKQNPSTLITEGDYDMILCSASTIVHETAEHLRGVSHKFCISSKFFYWPGRLLTHGVLL